MATEERVKNKVKDYVTTGYTYETGQPQEAVLKTVKKRENTTANANTNASKTANKDEEKPKKKKFFMVIGVVAVLGVAGYFVYKHFFAKKKA